MNKTSLKSFLESAYLKYNKFENIHPDPLEFVYLYKSDQDREIVGLIAASLAYGRVKQILVSVAKVLDVLGNNPKTFIESADRDYLNKAFSSFKHRFTTGEEVVELLMGIKGAIREYGTLGGCFISCLNRSESEITQALFLFRHELMKNSVLKENSLLPCPSRKSACKRFYMYLRWMIRKDDVDPGCWKDIPASILIIPLDTHMHSVSLELGLTGRKQADIKTAIEITQSLKKVCPNDPVKFDFCLTRPGIWGLNKTIC